MEALLGHVITLSKAKKGCYDKCYIRHLDSIQHPHNTDLYLKISVILPTALSLLARKLLGDILILAQPQSASVSLCPEGRITINKGY